MLTLTASFRTAVHAIGARVRTIRVTRWACLAVLGLVAVCGIASATTESTLFGFTLAKSGAFWPQGGLLEDASGNLYGATEGGGTYGVGTIFELSPPAQAGGAWTMTTLYNFQSYGGDGITPSSELTMDSAGALYGTAYVGGDPACSCGVVYKLSPPATLGGVWNEKILYAFSAAGSDGRLPNAAVVLDATGALYGVTQRGGTFDSGVIYQIAPQSDGTFHESVLYSFGNTNDASTPSGPLVFDSAGTLYGVAATGGVANGGALYHLIPPSATGGAWTESVLFSFGSPTSSGNGPAGNLVFDSIGNLYGVTSAGGAKQGYGVVYELSPATSSWTQSILWQFDRTTGNNPVGGLTRNPIDGSLYGTTTGGGATFPPSGTVFHLSPPATQGGQWTEATLYSFAYFGDGSLPSGRLTRDVNGTLYGTALNGGLFGCDGYCGTVFSVVP